MKRLYIFIGKHFPEFCALTAFAVILSSGSYLSWNYDPVWLNRAGTLIEIIGVLLAASRFHEWIRQKASNEEEQIFQTALTRIEAKAGEAISEEERSKLRATFNELLYDQLNAVCEPHKRRIKLWEIYLVICGAFLSGFGDYIVALLKSYGT
ncbi:hypothetical protein GALL_261440 [mine drainage metagenome]|uniref:Uncharacterized protein n=1 Tax=mine drainage metagenome TaxID=410659 RepID=A0A1J5RIK5_9ZZZZ